MPLTVMFQPKTGIEPDKGFKKPRAREVIAKGASGSVQMLADEVAILLSDEAVTVAHGSTPSATALLSTGDTSAAFDVPAGAYVLVFGVAGDTFAVAA